MCDPRRPSIHPHTGPWVLGIDPSHGAGSVHAGRHGELRRNVGINEKRLKVEGIGYQAAMDKKSVVLRVGYANKSN